MKSELQKVKMYINFFIQNKFNQTFFHNVFTFIS